MPETHDYPARLKIDYVEQHDRVTALLRSLLAIPIVILFMFLTISGLSENGTSISSGLMLATILMIVFRQKYPRWWFDFVLELSRFITRILAYVFLMMDEYPSTDEEQAVHLELDYPDAENDLNRWLPLVKWLLSLPHLVVLIVLTICMLAAVFAAWVMMLFTGRYHRTLFDFVEGVMRWWVRYWAYGFWLITDRYPPFSLRE